MSHAIPHLNAAGPHADHAGPHLNPAGRHLSHPLVQIARVLIVAGGVAVALTGCSGGGTGPADAPAPASSPLVLAPVDGQEPATAAGSAPPAQAAIGPVATVPATPGPKATPTRSASAPSRRPAKDRSSQPTATPAIAPPAPRSTCTHITTRVLRGSASFGREFAALQFTNSGDSTCRLNGYPRVTLLAHGAAVGSPAQPATANGSTYLLAPGATAESQLNDYVSCQAPLSDEVRVIVPGSSLHAVRPGQLRACTLRVTALAAPQ